VAKILVTLLRSRRGRLFSLYTSGAPYVLFQKLVFNEPCERSLSGDLREAVLPFLSRLALANLLASVLPSFFPFSRLILGSLPLAASARGDVTLYSLNTSTDFSTEQIGASSLAYEPPYTLPSSSTCFSPPEALEYRRGSAFSHEELDHTGRAFRWPRCPFNFFPPRFPRATTCQTLNLFLKPAAHHVSASLLSKLLSFRVGPTAKDFPLLITARTLS